MRITPYNISKLKSHEIFVFGSNPEGRHGKGAALSARQLFGAIYGQSEGLQGNSYAIITKELRKNKPPITLEQIKIGVDNFIDFVKKHPKNIFYVSKLGCSLAYFKVKDIAPLFRELLTYSNVYLPSSFIIELTLNK